MPAPALSQLEQVWRAYCRLGLHDRERFSRLHRAASEEAREARREGYRRQRGKPVPERPLDELVIDVLDFDARS